MSADSTARRCSASSQQLEQRADDVGEVVAAEQEEGRRADRTGRRPARRSAAGPRSTTASRQLSVSRSRRSDVALDGGAARVGEREVGDRGHPVGQRRQRATAARRARRALGGERPHRLQHPVAHAVRVGVGREHALVHQRRDVLGGRGVVDPEQVGDVADGVELEPVGEHGQPAEHLLLVVVEQAVRPLDRGPHRAVAILAAPAPARSAGRAGRRARRRWRPRPASPSAPPPARWPAGGRRAAGTARRSRPAPASPGRRRRPTARCRNSSTRPWSTDRATARRARARRRARAPRDWSPRSTARDTPP